MLKQYELKDYKFNLVILCMAISALGVVIVGSARESVQNKQIFGVVVGLVAMAVISLIDYRWVLNLYWLMYIANILMLAAIMFLGDDAGGATRWIEIGSFRFQPSELAKLILILFFAKFIMVHREDLNKAKTILKAVVLAGIPLFLVFKQPDLSTTICMAMIFCALMYVGGLSYKFIGVILAVGIPLVVIFLTLVVQTDSKILDNYQRKRIMAWIQPEKYASTEAYQQNNSIMAIGSGKLSGKGLNNNTVASVKNTNFISEPQTDFIFAIVGEETGFIGCAAVIILLLLIVIHCILIGRRAADPAGRYICCGVAGWIGFQSFINISVATGIFPNTGIPLPFVSYGLTSLVSLYMGIGFVLNVGLQPDKY